MNEREEFESHFPVPVGAYWGECVQQYCAEGNADSFACNYWMLWECWQAARAKPVVPYGWKLVPIEPTSVQDLVEVLEGALKVIDMLMPGVRYIAVQDYQTLNEAPIAARKAIDAYKGEKPCG